MSINSVMPSSHLILCHPILLLPPVLPNIRVFSNKSTLRIRWPKYLSFSFSISPSNEHPGLISFRMDWLDLLAVQGTFKSLLQHHSSNIRFHKVFKFVSHCCSVALSCPILCDPMGYSTPGFLVLYHLPELAQTQVCQVSDAIQISHVMSSPSPPAFNLSHKLLALVLLLFIQLNKVEFLFCSGLSRKLFILNFNIIL